MMTRQAWLTVLLLVLAAPRAATAQEMLTIERAVEATLTQNAALRAERAGAAEARARVTEARSGLFPRVSVTESWQRGDQPVFVFSSLLASRRFAAENFVLDALNYPPALGFFRTSLGVEQVVFDGGRQRSAIAAARLRGNMTDFAVRQTEASLGLAARQTFGRIVAAQAAEQAARAGVASAEEDLARAERRRDEGMITDAEVLALVVHVADLKQRALHAEGEAAVARAELNRLMGTPVTGLFRAVEPTSTLIARTGESELSAFIAEAEAARPELARARAATDVAAAARRQARAALVPEIAVQAAVDVNGTRFGNRQGSWIVGGELRWTLSTGGAELAALKAAGEAGARARAEYESARAAVQVEVVSAVRSLAAARSRQEVGRAAVDQARESQRIIRDRFEAGLATVNDVLRASTAVLDADANRTSALSDAITSEGQLRRALGRTP